MTLTTILSVAVALLCATVVIMLLLYNKSRKRPAEVAQESSPMFLLQQQVGELREDVRKNLDGQTQHVQTHITQLRDQMDTILSRQVRQMEQTSQGINTRMDTAARVIGDVQKELANVAERVKSVGELKDLLRAPKLRGGLGEVFLADLLGQILPREHFHLQHAFRNGKIVDAAVQLGEQLVPIDSKFPLENFLKATAAGVDGADIAKQARRQFMVDVRRHIDAVAEYIVPDEQTYDFALMYIPAENIYYEVAVKSEWGSEERPLLSHALQKKVVPVSPNTLYAYLYTISLGLRGMQVGKHAQEIIGRLGRVQKDFGRLMDDVELIGKHLTNARGAYDKVEKRLVGIDTKLATFVPETPEATAALADHNFVQITSAERGA